MKNRIATAVAIIVLSSAAVADRQIVNADGVIPPPTAMYQMQGSCETDLQPDVALIVGGVAVSAVKPTSAAEQLDKQLGLMEKYIEEKHGRLDLLERVRAVKVPNPNSNQPDPEGPFQLVQRLVAVFPPNAPVDEILEQMMSLGLDRFGDDVTNAQYGRPLNVVRFRFTDAEARVQKFQHQCLAAAWADWCNKQAPEYKQCVPEKPPETLQVQMFNARSTEKVLRPEGGSEYMMINSYAQHELHPSEILGNMPVHLEGHITAVYAYTRSSTP